LYSYVRHGEIRSEGSSITEGIGIMRLTHNFKLARVDDAVQVTDGSVVQMAHWLLRNEGLFVGSSSADVWAAAVWRSTWLLDRHRYVHLRWRPTLPEPIVQRELAR
jgi:cysteine synthase A